jgi:SAM-dependent methyltransferase
MPNPWLGIPEADYVGHMSHPSVNQRSVLNRLMREAVEDVRPRALLVLGCSSGNGLEHVDRAVTERVAVVDINSSYLDRLAARFPHPGFALEIRCADVNDTALEGNAFDLVHAALVFEYVTWQPLIRRVALTLTGGGMLSVVLQLPARSTAAVTPTPFTSLRSLESLFHFVDPDALIEVAGDEELTLAFRRTEPLASGKAFEVLRFIR